MEFFALRSEITRSNVSTSLWKKARVSHRQRELAKVKDIEGSPKVTGLRGIGSQGMSPKS